MTIKELKKVIQYLPDDLQIDITNIGKRPPRLVKEFWGNHDGRYNVKCEACGWQSPDIPRNGYPPHTCEKCGKGIYQGDD